MIEPILGLFALFMLILQGASCAIAAWRCRTSSAPPVAVLRSGRISLVRTVSGLERFSETLESSFLLNHDNYEVLFCVARADDAIVPVIRTLMKRFPCVDAHLLIGNDRISPNPKLNNMVKGWRAATGSWVIFADSNIILPPDYLQRVTSAWRFDTGLVSAPPVGGSPDNWWSEVECALLNSYQARWQYSVDTLGFGFGQGKTLAFRREQLKRMGFEGLASEPAEDAAATKLVRLAGLRVRLASPPFFQPLGQRTFSEVWGRHLRWARLRRMTFGVYFWPEIFAGAAIPAISAAAFAELFGFNPLIALFAYLSVWYGCEYALAVLAGWPASLRSLVAFIARDISLPVLWIAALHGENIFWNGATIPLQRGAQASDP